MSTLIWLYILIGSIIIVLLYYIKRLAHVQVWIYRRPAPGTKLTSLGYLEMDGDGSAGEVHIPGSGSLPSVGRVIVDKQAGRTLGFVEVATTDISDETATPKYKQEGFIAFNQTDVVDRYGYIYRQERGKRKKVLVGYCARPSAPNTPTLCGERTWRSLWLRCTLNLYAGRPDAPQGSAPLQQAEPAKAERLYIAANNEAREVGVALEAHDVADVLDSPADAIAPDTDNTPIEATAPIAEQIPQKDVATANPMEVEDAASIIDNETSEKEEPAKTEASDDARSKEVTPEPQEQAQDKSSEQQEEQQEEQAEGKKGKKDKKSKDKRKRSKKCVKEAWASVSYLGFHVSSQDYLPAEARACAFAALAGDLNRGRYTEYFKAQPYGWKDTALLTSLLYSVIFFALYIAFEVVLKRSIFSSHYVDVVILVAMYFPLWTLVRLIKIDCIESSNSFQKRLDLFNKNLGLKGSNFVIVILGILVLTIDMSSMEYDFVPLVFAMTFGVFVNMSLKGASSKWVISTSFNEKDDVEDDVEEVANPTGDIARTYEWELDKTYNCSQDLYGSLTLYFTAREIADMRQCNPFFAQRKDKSDKLYILGMFQFLNVHRTFLARTKYITRYINDLIKKNNLTPIDKVQFTLDFVQEPNIRYVDNRESRAINNYEHYIRYPDETLFDKEGDSNSKSLLAAVLFYTMGHNVMYLASRKHNHSAIGIEIDSRDLANGLYGANAEEMIVTEDGKTYIYCETTGDRFSIGKSISGMEIRDFEEKVLLEVESVVPVTVTKERSIIYNWSLDSVLGNTLHGNLVLKFSDDYIEHLREINPFRSYGYDSSTYAGNIESMFQRMKNDVELMQNVDFVAHYIKHEVSAANLPELDLVQFALNFVQVPNISYCIDEECASIDFKTEYMRYPDETLFDKEGDCDCKSFLTASILNRLGYNVVYLLSSKLKHAAIAIECKAEWFDVIANTDANILEHNGRRYVFCESTGSGNKVGQIKEGDSIKDFDTVIELLV